MTATLHLTSSLNPVFGGVPEVVRQLCGAHFEKGHRDTVTTFDLPDAAWLTGFPADVHCFPGKRGYGFSPPLFRWLSKHATDFERVLVHGLWQFPALCASLVLPRKGVPYFIFPHGMMDSNLSSVFGEKLLKKNLYWKAVEQHTVCRAASLLFTCEQERQLARGTFRPYRAREALVPLGIAEPQVDLTQARTNFLSHFPQFRDQRLLLFLGRIHAKKGCDMLLEAMRELAPPLHLVMAGPCEDPAYLSQLKTTAMTSTSFVGMLTGNLKWGALASAEAFILPSHQENFGIAVAEALAVGTPVLISNKVNIWREIHDAGAGIVENDDPRGTQRLISRWLSGDEPISRAAAQRCFQRHFERQVMVENLEAVTASSGSRRET